MKTTDKREAGKYVRDSTQAEMLQNTPKCFSSSLSQLLPSMLNKTTSQIRIGEVG